MRKPISPRVHGVLDYATVAAVAAAPQLLDLPENAERLCYALAGGYAALSAMTDYPLAVKRAVPFPAHGAIEGAIGLALPAAPWLLGFGDDRTARNLFFGLTALTAVVAAMTDWKGESRARSGGRAAARKVRARAA